MQRSLKMSNITEGTSKDWEDFWYAPEKFGSWGKKEITLEQYQEAQKLIKEYERQCNLKEQAYYDARAKLDAQQEYLSTKSKYYFDRDRNK